VRQLEADIFQLIAGNQAKTPAGREKSECTVIMPYA